ncbi:MAG: hypothetical protein AOA65_1151 [Candidatus Bathyarchaeota archaeon BA1]|nr:MAG: hypothetical protein AOA65_1151 [Candidatus Bathyarchaeota archaeon BA1]
MLIKPKIVPKHLISQLQLQVGKAKIPRILLGTSVFIGAGQFGRRAQLYYNFFYENPRNIVKIICKAVDLGVMGVQALPSLTIFGALKVVERELKERLTIVGTIGPDDPSNDIRDFQGFNTVAMLLHAEITDRRDPRKISELLNKVHAANCLAGLATHKPLSTLNWLLKNGLDIDLLMLPFNQLGMFMDASPVKVAGVIKRLGKPIIGKKVLAAGYLPPQDALTYVAQLGCIDVVALGIASEEEARETLSAATTAFSGRISA